MLKVKQTKSGFSCSLFIFPRAGPDIKYFLGFVRTQLSTSTTIALVFGPKVLLLSLNVYFYLVLLFRLLEYYEDKATNGITEPDPGE